MIRATLSFLLSAALMLAGLAFADARGRSHDIGVDMVICTGTGITVVTIGPDGQPVEKSEPCPDGASVFSAVATAPTLPAPILRLLGRLPGQPAPAAAAKAELAPSARGPPAFS